jgi:hypothetical protein
MLLFGTFVSIYNHAKDSHRNEGRECEREEKFSSKDKKSFKAFHLLCVNLSCEEMQEENFLLFLCRYENGKF